MASSRVTPAGGVPGASARQLGRHEQRVARARRLLALGCLLAGLALAAVAAVGGWAVFFYRAAPRPAAIVSFWPAGCLVLLVMAAALWPRGDPARWWRGAAGEEATAALLGRLTSKRWVVLHDLRLPVGRANIDHLVIGPTGVWVVDSKAYRARLKARRGRLWAGTTELDLAPVRWEAEIVSELLGVRATPLVAVHGNGLPRRGRLCGGTRVVPAASVLRRLRRGALLRPALSRRRARQLGSEALSALTRPSAARPSAARPSAARSSAARSSAAGRRHA